jgi:hypothetical protein
MLCGLALWLAAGCEEHEDFDHDPPPGLGSLVIDNWVADDLDVFLDGEYAGEVDDNSDRIFDLAPGVYRLVLSDDDGDRSFRDDVDVLEGRLTVLTVRYGGADSASFLVNLRFD